ncbi:MAG TPA: hypothetical protein VKK79_06175 [Candidatus Lokiarchaeia archaeon]|nr:hypothetical protein [Candidatus Lokiarchaeia archaeon]
MSDLSGLVQDLQRKLKERDGKIKNLEEQLKGGGKPGAKKAPADSAASLQQKIMELETANAQLLEELSTARESSVSSSGGATMGDLAQDLQKKIKKKDEEIARLKAGGKASKGEPRPDAEDPAQLQQKIAELDSEVQELRQELTEEKSKSAKSQDSGPLASLVKELQVKLKAKDKEIVALKKNATAAGLKKPTPPPEESPELTGEVDRLTGELESANTRVSELDAQVENLQKQVRQKEDLLQTQQEENRLLKEQASEGGPVSVGSRLAEENHVLSEKLTKARQQIQFLTEEMGKKNQDIMLLQEFRNKDAFTGVQSERTNLRDQLDQVEKRNQALLGRVSMLEKEQEEAGTHQQMLRIRELRSMLDTMKRQIRLQNQELIEIKRKSS